MEVAARFTPSQQVAVHMQPLRTGRIKRRRGKSHRSALLVFSQLWLCCFLSLYPRNVSATRRSAAVLGPSTDNTVRNTARDGHAFVYAIRGGKDNSKNDTKAVGDELESKSQQEPRSTSKLWSASALYRMNEDAMADAQIQKEADDDPKTAVDNDMNEEKPGNMKNKKKNERQHREEDQSSQSRRGDILTTSASTPASEDDNINDNSQQPRGNGNIFRWLSPSLSAGGAEGSVDIDKRQDLNEDEQSVSGNADKQEKLSEDEEDIDSSAKAKAQADLAQLWWVNMWTQQQQDQQQILGRPASLDGRVSDSKDTKKEKEASKLEKESMMLREMHDSHKKKQRKSNSNKATKKHSKAEKEKSIYATKKGQEKEIVMPSGTGVQHDYENIKNVTSLLAQASEPQEAPKDYVSSGYWAAIDGLTSLGLSRIHPVFRISRTLRPLRKVTARVTGLHGALSGKPRVPAQSAIDVQEDQLGEEDLAMVRRRIAAIDKAREGVDKITKAEQAKTKRRGGWFGRKEPVEIPEVPKQNVPIATVATGMTDIPSIRKTPEELEEEQSRKERVQEIDKLMSEASRRLAQLACEKDELQRRHNPLWNYTTERASKKRGNRTTITTRKINFPPDDLVDEYLDFLISSHRLITLNHTDLWQADANLDDDDDPDDFLDDDGEAGTKKQRNNGNNGGSWLLRQSIGSKQTLGEKIGEAAEQAAYKSIAKAVMEVLAKSISALHGVNIMMHTDIRLSMEATPDLPPMSKHGIIPGGRNPNYARDALQGAMRRGARKNGDNWQSYDDLSYDDFVQRDAVVETLLSHCQISAPLLTLFPLAWQRAMLGNIITLVTAVVADFCEGVEFEILGHKLAFSFKPITEKDMIDHLSVVGSNFNRHIMRSEQFEAAVQATANDVSENLKFLDRWHERALGSGMLRSQIANLIARLVLIIVGEILGGAKMDLWAAQAGGPRMVAGLEFRTTSTYMNPI